VLLLAASSAAAATQNVLLKFFQDQNQEAKSVSINKFKHPVISDEVNTLSIVLYALLT
jgi:hypothetical protein